MTDDDIRLCGCKEVIEQVEQLSLHNWPTPDLTYTCKINWLYKIRTEFSGLKSKANAEVPQACFFSYRQQGATKIRLYVNLWENDPTFHLIYYLCYQFSNEFMVSGTTF